MKTRNIINKKVLMLLFSTITLLLILENPSISQINIYYSYTSISQTQPQLNDGVFIQGSSIISQNTIIYVNQTTNQPVWYKSILIIFNFGSFLVLFLPIVIYMYYEYIPVTIKITKQEKVK